MKESVKDALELFIEKADKLTQEEFTQFMQEIGHRFSYQVTPEQMTVTTVAPTETMNNSFLLTYRFFVHARDNIGFIDPTQRISKLLTDPSLSPQWLEQFQDVAQKTHANLREKPHFMPMQFNLRDLQGNTRTDNPTRWDILETILYGDAAHATQRKRLNDWLSTPYKEWVWRVLMTEFRDILMYTLYGIRYLAHYARIELDLPQGR